MLLVVVDDLDVISVAIGPVEADAPLVVYSDAVLTGSVTAQLFETVARRHTQVL